VQIRATVVSNPAIATEAIGVNATASNNDTAIVVGGTAGSVAFGQASSIEDPGLGRITTYSFPMSVIVADSNGSPAPQGTVVNIGTWPIAWSTGTPCSIDADDGVSKGTFFNEDSNENLFLDAGEDGTRIYYGSGVPATGPSTSDGVITPVNSYGGTVTSANPADLPGTATTDASGVANFFITYTKSSALWIISRIRAQTLVQGSPAVGQLDFRLLASQSDVLPICLLPASPFNY